MIPLSKIAVAKDNSYDKLYDLMYNYGYDRVRWVNTEELGSPCPLCKWIEEQVNADGGLDLAHFLGFKKNLKFIEDPATGEKVPDLDPETHIQKVDYEPVQEIYKNAPIYNWAHVGCKCCLLVFKSTDNQDMILVTRAG